MNTQTNNTALTQALVELEKAGNALPKTYLGCWYDDGPSLCCSHQEAERKVATTPAETVNEAILKLEFGVECYEDFAVIDADFTVYFDAIKSALVDLRRLMKVKIEERH